MRQSSRPVLSRFQIAAIIAPLVLTNGACVVPQLRQPDPVASLRVRVTLERHEDANLRTFVAHNFRVAPRPALPTAEGEGGGMVAFTSERRRQWPWAWIFVLQEGSDSTLSINVFPVSYRQEGEAATTIANSEPHAAPSPPCESWSGFFLKGVGDVPRSPVVLHRWGGDGPSRSISVEPAHHTLVLRPVLRFSTRDVKELRNRKATFLLGVTVIAGTEPFVLLGLVRRPDGSYSEAVFVPKGVEQGWSAFAHTPGETTEISFYALDDSPRHHSVCRAAR